MKLPNIKVIGKTILDGVKEYSPEILTGIGLVSVITGTVMAIKVSPTVVKKLDKKKEELGTDKLDPIDVVRTVGVDYIPVVIPVVTGSACIIGGAVMRYKKNIGLATMLGMTEATLNNYKDKVIEEIGEKKESKIQDELAQDDLNRHPLNQARYDIFETGFGNQLFYDPIGLKYFHHDLEVMRRQTAEMNLDGFTQGGVSLNEWRIAIGLRPIDSDIGDPLGWRDQFSLDIRYESADDGAPCGYVKWDKPPEWNYYKIH